MRSAILALVLCASASAQTVEDFEHGNEGLYGFATTGDNMDLDGGAAHDGALGAQFGNGTSGWRLRTDVTTSPGHVYSCYARARGGVSGNGRSYLGVGADNAGTWSAVFGPNTNELQLQDNTGYNFATAALTSFTFSPDVWYVMRLDWALNGDMTVELLDESATTILASVGPVATGYTTPGGLALRGFTTFSSTWLDFDTVRDGGPPPPPTTFCTAGVSTHGCVPAISASAQPSASAASVCVLSVANVEGQKSGMIFYGLDNTGFTPLPWSPTSTSFFCVKSPVQRSLPQSSGGTVNACDGTLALDWNAFQAAFPGALGQPWAVGDKAFAQAWYRDPPASRTTNLSDAIELTNLP